MQRVRACKIEARGPRSARVHGVSPNVVSGRFKTQEQETPSANHGTRAMFHLSDALRRWPRKGPAFVCSAFAARRQPWWGDQPVCDWHWVYFQEPGQLNMLSCHCSNIVARTAKQS